MKNRTKLILVEDHLIFSQGLTALLKQHSEFEVSHHFTKDRDLMVFLEQYNLEDVIVLLDLSMPGSDGFRLLEHLKSRFSSTPVCVLSMFNDPFIIRKAKDLGAEGYILKSSGFFELLNGLRSIEYGNQYLDAAITDINANNQLPSERELEVLRLLGRGYSSKMIGSKLNISFNTVESHRKNLLKKSGEKTTGGLLNYYRSVLQIGG